MKNHNFNVYTNSWISFQEMKSNNFVLSISDLTMETSKSEAHFKNIIYLGIQKKLPWDAIASILREMSLTLEEISQLVKVLLIELESM